MGTNFYTLNGKHIGKRYSAGIWCWDCKRQVSCDRRKQKWICTKCGKHSTTKNLSFNLVYLGLLAKTIPKYHHTIDGASGFIWCIGEFGLGNTRDEVKQKLKRLKFVRTGYKEKWPIKKFNKMFGIIIEESEQSGEFC